MPLPGQPIRILWQRLDESPGLEWCELGPNGEGGLRAAGTVLIAWQGAPHRVDYAIDLDPLGRTRHVRLTAAGGERRSLELESDGLGRWWGPQDPALLIEATNQPPAIDVDLGVTPFTNSLPIWRLQRDVEPGTSREVRVAWVLFPSFEVVEGSQTYTRLSDRRWRYASDEFEADLELDGDGLVLTYGTDWRAIARS